MPETTQHKNLTLGGAAANDPLDTPLLAGSHANGTSAAKAMKSPISQLEPHAKPDTMNCDSPGGTSQRCETAPGVSFLDGFKPKSIPEPALDLVGQATKLKENGLSGDLDTICAQLSQTSYSHLKPYHALFFDEDGHFTKGSTITDLVDACNFDRRLQSCLMHYIGVIEIRLRCTISYHLALERGVFAHIDQNTFANTGRMSRMVHRYRRERNRRIRRGDTSAKGYMARYGEFPIWAAVEAMSLGTLSMLFQNIASNTLKKEICKSFSVPPKVMQGWLRTLSFARNECAHFGNLYGKSLLKESPRVEGYGPYDNRSLFHICAIVQKLLGTGEAAHADSFPSHIEQEMKTFHIDPASLGFPEAWKEAMVATIHKGRRLAS